MLAAEIIQLGEFTSLSTLDGARLNIGVSGFGGGGGGGG